MTPGSAHSFANAPAYRAARGSVGVLCVLVLALPAAAFIPKAKRVVAEVTRINRRTVNRNKIRFTSGSRFLVQGGGVTNQPEKCVDLVVA